MNTYVNKPFKPPRKVGNDDTDTLINHGRAVKNGTLPAKLFTKHADTNKTTSNRPASAKRSYAPSSAQTEIHSSLALFTATYRKVSAKKNKTWDGDGFANYVGKDKLKFYNQAGMLLGTVLFKDQDLYETVWRVGINEFQIDYKISDPNELASVQEICKINSKCREETIGAVLTKKSKLVPETSSPRSKPFIPKVSSKFKSAVRSKTGTAIMEPMGNSLKSALSTNSTLPPLSQEVIAKVTYSPVFDPTSIPEPLIMNKSSAAKVDVIMDPLLSKCLRPHQREGVKFLYDCVMGLVHKKSNESELLATDDDISGCLLADEMGLGKTLMTIALIWTLLKQTAYPKVVSQRGMPLMGEISKVVIVCPVTLIGNWKKEFKKWLSLNRIGVLTLNSRNTCSEDKVQVRNFLRVPKTYQVLIVGYEKLLSIKEALQDNKEKIDMVICDEGHRLKNKDSKILKVLKSLEIAKKVVLSGTPIQNDLEEFFTIIDFINPGILGSFNRFKKEYINPISRSRDVASKHNERLLEQGRLRSEDLIQITRRFILRRTNELLAQYLPPRTDLIVFCKPTNTQLEAFNRILSQGGINFNNMTYTSSLGLITLFKKICNSTSLMRSDSYYGQNLEQVQVQQTSSIKDSSGKMKVLFSMLQELKSVYNEKVVIISNYTQTLDIIEGVCASEGYSSSRLDGSTSAKTRDQIVSSFNNDPNIFVFLLSAKSGGVGLNLIGASRLVLFDNDWNPSIDLQAMSRIHRDGQKRPCFIYRLVTTGCIDEKILQRQLMKIALSKKFLDSEANKNKNEDDLFQQEELKDLFTVNVTTRSNTHDLICNCSGEGEEFDEGDEDLEIPEQKSTMNSIKSVTNDTTHEEILPWMSALDAKRLQENEVVIENKSKTDLMRKCLLGFKHIDPSKTQDLIDEVLTNVFLEHPDSITYAFVKTAS